MMTRSRIQPVAHLALALIVLMVQPAQAGSRSESVRLNRNKPMVYMAVERMGPRKPLYLNESKEGVWLRLHNNSRWTIALGVNGIAKEYGDALVPYEIRYDGPRAGEAVPRGYGLGDAYSEMTLKPGASIVFSVPKEHLREGYSIHVPINFAWDKREGYAGFDDELEHFVRFALD